MIEEATSSKHSDTTDAPLVSVVAPCFNAEKYLEEALRSIYEQDYPNFEVIIVDDGSTDNSYAMLEQLQKVHGFQLYRQQNQGVSAALNFGLGRTIEFVFPYMHQVVMTKNTIKNHFV